MAHCSIQVPVVDRTQDGLGVGGAKMAALPTACMLFRFFVILSVFKLYILMFPGMFLSGRWEGGIGGNHF